MKNRIFKITFALMVISGASAAWAAAPTLTGGSTTGAAGSPVLLPITFNSNGSSVVGLQFTLTAPTGVTVDSVNPTPGTLLNSSSKLIASNVASGSASATYLVTGVYSLPPATGSCGGSIACGNLNTISSGTLMNVQLRIAGGTAAGAKSISLSNVVYADNTNTATAGTQSIAPGATTAGTVNVTATSPCDVNGTGGLPNVGDAIAEVNGLLNPSTLCILPGMDLNQSNSCDPGDVQRIVNAILSGGLCVVGP
jgi:hypothetical protein